MGESINEAVILRWIKNDGDQVAADEPICELETDKATFDLPAPAAGTLKTIKAAGDTVRVGEVVAEIAEATADDKAKSPAPIATETPPRAPRGKAESGSVGRPATTGDTASAKSKRAAPPEPRRQPSVTSPPPPDASEGSSVAKPARPSPPPPTPTQSVSERPEPQGDGDGAEPAEKPQPASTTTLAREQAAPPARPVDAEGTRRVPMSKIRLRIAERLVRAQRTAAMLTTFNEIDMTAVLDLREQHKQQFEQTHGVSLGLMSFFSRACVLALKQFPAINAEIEGSDIVYHEHVHLGVAVSTDRGLVVPVLRHVEQMSFAEIESEIKRVATAARDGKLALQELSGGTFTITNGGVFGSLLSTPILNPPQSGILGMHTIQKRPMVINDRIKARRMMYVALSYDHRLVDGRDAVLFLVKLKGLLEDPMSMLLEG